MATVLYGITGKLLGKLSASALQEIVELWGLGSKEELEKLERTLSTIKAVLLDAEEKQETNHELRDWLNKLKVALYEVDDLLDDFSVEILRRKLMTRRRRVKEVRIFFSRKNQVSYRLKLGSKVRTVREKLNVIAGDRAKFGLVERLGELHVKNKRREETHSFVPLNNVIGRKDDTDAVVELLRSDIVEGNVSTISIVGIGGLGKTTLAQLVYKYEKERQHFDLVMWVCVSDIFEIPLICKSIIKSATGVECRSSELEGVKDELKVAIDGKRYLLVLDDVWNEDRMKWLRLEELLFEGARGSRILVTCRAQLVADTVKSFAVYELEGLSPKDSWSLFEQMACKQLLFGSSTVREIGNEIVKKCSGVPLAIKAIGSTLCEEKNESDWLYFKSCKLPKITQESKSGIMPILKLSYDYLSPPLKQCFVYCAVFPKDHIFTKETLIQMWIAQGFIQLLKRNEILEEVGKEYFQELLRKSFFEEFEIGSYRFYKMHDLNHDLAQSLQGNEICSNDMDDLDATTRHAWVNSRNGNCSVPKSTFPFGKVKSLRTFIYMEAICSELELKNILRGLGRVRVLKLTLDATVQNLPSRIGMLIHLSYLDLSCGSFLHLPESICNLHNLQTLKLDFCTELQDLPERTSDLANLRYLDISGCDRLSHMPRGLGKLTCLHTLTNFNIGPKGGPLGEQLDELKSIAVHLRVNHLAVDFKGTIRIERDDYASPLTEMSLLDSLDIGINVQNSDEEEPDYEDQYSPLLKSLEPPSNLKFLSITAYKRLRFPSWMNNYSLDNIVRISLIGCRSHTLPSFGLLPSLQSLELNYLSSLEYIYEEKDANDDDDDDNAVEEENYSVFEERQLFPSLEVLHLEYMWSLKGLGRRKRMREEVEAQHFPELQEIHIVYCQLLDSYEPNDDEENVIKQFQSLYSLKTMKMSFSYDLKTLPQWIFNLTLLEHLHLDDCHSLESLPDCMRRLTSLQQLVIGDCSPELANRCKEETGEDWPNIAHIPLVTLKLRRV